MSSGSTIPAKWPASAEVTLGGGDHPSPPPSLRRRIAILAAMWLVVIGPFLFLRSEWFGRPLSDQQIGEYLHAEEPSLVEHALTQIGDRMARHDRSVNIWYPDLIRLTGHDSPDVRAMDATVMSTDVSRESFHQALLPMLHDTSGRVRFRAALALAQFGDASGHDYLVAALHPWPVPAPEAGRIREIVHSGAQVRRSAVLARLDSRDRTIAVLAPESGRVTSVAFSAGQAVPEGAELMQVDPGADVIADVMAALQHVGGSQDIPLATAIQARTSLPERVRQQAALAVRSIQQRTGNSAEVAKSPATQN
jgi:hypothetical protein